MKIVVIAVLMIAIAGMGAALWISARKTDSSDARRAFFEAPQEYDTSGGQQMQPRWNE